MLRSVYLNNFRKKLPSVAVQTRFETTSSAVNEKCPLTIDHKSSQPSCPQSAIDADEFKNARPTSEIPGPKSLPIIGIMHYFFPGGKFYNVEMADLHTLMREEYGDLVRLPRGLGRPDMVFTYDPDNFAKLYRNEGQYPHRRSFAIFEYFRKNERPDLFKGKAGLLSDQGPEWYDTRTRVNPVMLQPKTAKKYLAPVEQIVDEFCARIRSIRDSNNETPPDFSNEMNKWSLESIACIGMDTRLGLMGDIEKDSDGQRMIQSVHDFFQYSYELEIMPSIWKYYKTPTFKKLIQSLHVLTDTTSKFVDAVLEKLQTKSKDDNQSGEISVLEKLLQIDRNLAILMSLDMLMAGVDTTAHTSITVMYHLAKNPEKQDKLRQEVFAQLPEKDSPLTPEKLANIPYLRACIKEAGRLNPVNLGNIRKLPHDVVMSGYIVPKGCEVNLGNIRKLPHDVVMSGYIVPKGCEVATGNNTLMNDDQYFKDSAQFLPERFLKNNDDISIKGKHPYVYLPIGFGPRMCVGRRFAELEMEVLIAKIIRNFEIKWNYPNMQWECKLLNIPSGNIRFQFNDIQSFTGTTTVG